MSGRLVHSILRHRVRVHPLSLIELATHILLANLINSIPHHTPSTQSAMATLLPPQDGPTYPTLDALILQIQQHAIQQGYAIVIGRSKTNKKGERRKA